MYEGGGDYMYTMQPRDLEASNDIKGLKKVVAICTLLIVVFALTLLFLPHAEININKDYIEGTFAFFFALLIGSTIMLVGALFTILFYHLFDKRRRKRLEVSKHITHPL